MEKNITKNNHYVPQFYLRNWSKDGKTIWAYRTLVSNNKVPLWEQMSIDRVASHQHLYTVDVDGEPSDEIEKWFNSEFETPAQSAIEKVLSGTHLKREDYQLLMQFLAVQMVRTPSWHEYICKLIVRDFPDTIRNIGAKLDDIVRNKKPLPPRIPSKEPDRFQVHAKVIPGEEDTAYIKAEIYTGQKMWLSEVQRMLPKIIPILNQHSWCILEAASDVDFPTTDDPVVRLGYRSDSDYWFNGVGINQKNATLFMPLSPKHIFLTEVGKSMKSRQLDIEKSKLFSRVIINHANRHVFSINEIKGMTAHKPRIVNPDLFKAEQEAWENWQQSQREAEREWDSFDKM